MNMNRIKLVFSQSLMISTGILFGLGIQSFINYLVDENYMLVWPWYIPISIILCGIACSVPTFLIDDAEGLTKSQMRVRNVAHYLALLLIVAVIGYVFNWYDDWIQFAIILINYSMIYAFVWIVTWWFGKVDEDKINKALDDFRDEE